MRTQTPPLPGGGSGTGWMVLAAYAATTSLIGCTELDLGAAAEQGATSAGQTQIGKGAGGAKANIDPSMEPAPDLFATTGLAVWDGSETLQGVWIAHPDADVARRVRLTNDETGVQADAAMLRRDPNWSGPQMTISSGAARLLKLTPGHGTPITIVGLDYRAAAVAAEDEATEEPALDLTEAAVDEAPVGGTPADLTATDETPVESTPETENEATVEATTEPSAAALTPEPSEAATETPAPPPEVIAPASAATEAANDTAASVEAVEGAEPGASEFVPATTSDIAAPEPVAKPQALAPDAPQAETPADGDGDITDGRTFIQAGVFGQPENAMLLVEKLRAAGLDANAKPLTLGERQFTRVLVGPYRTVVERDAALETVRRLGPADATPAKG